MPEGDTIHRAADTLQRALAGRVVTRFQSVFPQLTRVDDTAPLAGRVIERVEARGKHLLMHFSGDLLLRTHMRMHGSWHIYRPGERWQRPRHEMRIAIETDAFHAVGFSVPIAEFLVGVMRDRSPQLQQLGPDPLDERFDADEAVTRLRARPDMEIAEGLLDQTALAGIGNVYKSEVLFLARVHPFTHLGDVTEEQLRRIVDIARRLMQANAPAFPANRADEDMPAITSVPYSGMRRTTRRADPSARLWVYGRAGKPCRRCGTVISRRKQGPHARSTYWCATCQPTPAF